MVTLLQAVKFAGDAAYVDFLDIWRTFDYLPHTTILRQLRSYKLLGRIYGFAAAFLRHRSFVVRACGITKGTWNVTKCVPKGSG